ncbi:Signal peptidase complex subunit SPC2 [Fulvia fulva]|uniref:Signal peptidase complex subunit 2 n=1 Tax=Passalora fulva TaxID=5499 RepID=A0A9Q8L7D4_PASFU|nr:Signal peptidase complex subunit SPC2 [Fulvia fulva]KAK4634918.1 Signal peptidase complex subunit SPC2 [Fulvia fulva]UJO12084.1 Signal peptidase complex subunit SPC2 [Fulvia fulva]WPV08728.1 Signal peptidase complex subunit SPC2 [Fulvia fulva]WPV23677.1 Signal peptidase complex subunit SPC2 [Fulvia fulva]
MSDSRISPYSLNDLKNTTDDALGNYLRGLSFKQDNSKLDVRLALGYVAVIIAGATFAADYKLGWEATKYWTAVAVAAYAILNGALTYWIWAVEQGLVFEGTHGGTKVSIAAKTKKHDPTYYLTVSTTKPNAPATSRQLQAPFTTWFTADGYFVAKPFQQWIASSIEEVGDVDLKNANRDERDELAAPTAKVELLQSGDGGVDVTGNDSKAKGSKRSKREV